MWFSEQQPLRLNPTEVHEVITAVCAESSSPNSNVTTLLSRFNSNSGTPSMDVAVSVLIKLVIDMYVLLSLILFVLSLKAEFQQLPTNQPPTPPSSFSFVSPLPIMIWNVLQKVILNIVIRWKFVFYDVIQCSSVAHKGSFAPTIIKIMDCPT